MVSDNQADPPGTDGVVTTPSPVLAASGGTQPHADVGASNVAVSGVQLMPRGYTLTMPENDDFFGVREDQLDELAAGGRGISLEVALVCLGTALGYIPSIIETVWTFWEKGTIRSYQILFACLFAVLIALSVAKFLEHRRTKKSIDFLKGKIKAGQKLTITPVTSKS